MDGIETGAVKRGTRWLTQGGASTRRGSACRWPPCLSAMARTGM